MCIRCVFNNVNEIVNIGRRQLVYDEHKFTEARIHAAIFHVQPCKSTVYIKYIQMQAHTKECKAF